MMYLSDFERCQIVGTRLARASVTETSQFLEISSGTMIKFMTAYTHCSKTSSANENNGLKEKFSERDRRVLKRFATSKMLTTAKLYQHLDQGPMCTDRATPKGSGGRRFRIIILSTKASPIAQHKGAHKHTGCHKPAVTFPREKTWRSVRLPKEMPSQTQTLLDPYASPSRMCYG
ncbi:hypothetical protein TNCV_805271 [Trichonephila clavipes]|nr:hypothetical protein TNCV_805271 [Trichonephila clavipes]